MRSISLALFALLVLHTRPLSAQDLPPLPYDNSLLQSQDELLLLNNIIQLGYAGETDEAVRHLHELWRVRVHHDDTWPLQVFRDEDSFTEKGPADAQRWGDAFLTFTARQQEQNVGQVFAHILNYKNRATRDLQRTYVALRNTAPEVDPEKPERMRKRRELARQLLAVPGEASNHADVSRMIGEVRDSLFEVGGNMHGSLGPDALKTVHGATAPAFAQALPRHSAYIEIVTYNRIDGPAKLAPRSQEHWTTTRCYAAFILANAKGRITRTLFGVGGDPSPKRVEIETDWTVHRIELGPSEPIDSAVANWRRALLGGETASAEASRVADLVWKPIQGCLPPETANIFVCPDGNLAALPWPAVPVSSSRILLEDFRIALVPFAHYLLQGLTVAPEELKYGGEPPQYDVLAIGGVFDDLPASQLEVDRLKDHAGSRKTLMLDARTASVDRVLSELPQASVAHFATHGFFASQALERARSQHLFGPNSSTVQNAMYFAGLLVAPRNSNDRLQDRVLIADMIGELDLSFLRLAVLSACETGTGETAAGEGTFGIARAFHLAGCADVIATLWKINDEASAALMNEFYSRLWHKQMTPIDALREAQLFVYRHPELVTDLARNRFPLQSDEIRRETIADSGRPSDANDSNTPPKFWAAFILSGSGGLRAP